MVCPAVENRVCCLAKWTLLLDRTRGLYPQSLQVRVLLPNASFPPFTICKGDTKIKELWECHRTFIQLKRPHVNTFFLLGSLSFQSLPMRIPVWGSNRNYSKKCSQGWLWVRQHVFRLLHTLGGIDVDVINTLLDEETEAEAVSGVPSGHTLLDSTCKPAG